MEHPSWVASGLKRVGVYYEGVVENAEEVLEKHNCLTITTYGTRTSTKSASVKREREGNKEKEVSDQEKTMVSPIVLFEEAKMSMFFSLITETDTTSQAVLGSWISGFQQYSI